MRNLVLMKNKPPYALQSVDHVLQLLQILRDNGTLRVSEAARGSDSPGRLSCTADTASVPYGWMANGPS
jgi:hypothetical protein